jgi:hypothetical protein
MPAIPEHFKDGSWKNRFDSPQSPQKEQAKSDKPGSQSSEKENLTTGKDNSNKIAASVPISKQSYGDKLGLVGSKYLLEALKGDVKETFKKLTTDPGFVAQLVGLGVAFAALQATPAGPLIDGVMLATLGLSAGFSLVGFLHKTWQAKDEKGLKAAAGDLAHLVEIIGLAGISRLLSVSGRALRALGATKAAAKLLNRDSLVVDSNVLIAQAKQAKGLQLQSGEEALLKRLAQLGKKDLRASDTTKAEIQGKHPNLNPKGISISVSRTSPEYKALLKNLENPTQSWTVGRNKGVADRNIVADAFFAKTEPGVIPQFATADKNIYNPLARRGGIEPDKLGKSIDSVYSKGFEVTINGRTIRVIPLPRK